MKNRRYTTHFHLVLLLYPEKIALRSRKALDLLKISQQKQAASSQEGDTHTVPYGRYDWEPFFMTARHLARRAYGGVGGGCCFVFVCVWCTVGKGGGCFPFSPLPPPPPTSISPDARRLRREFPNGIKQQGYLVPEFLMLRQAQGWDAGRAPVERAASVKNRNR